MRKNTAFCVVMCLLVASFTVWAAGEGEERLATGAFTGTIIEPRWKTSLLRTTNKPPA